MSNRLEEIVGIIKAKTKFKSNTAVAKTIGYSRVHLEREIKKKSTSELENLLLSKHSSVFQNESNVSHGTPNSLESELPLGDLRVTVKDYLDLLLRHSEIMTRLVEKKIINSGDPLGSNVGNDESQELRHKYGDASFSTAQPQEQKDSMTGSGKKGGGHTSNKVK